MSLLARWALSTGTLLLLPVIFGSRVEFDDIPTAIVAAVAVGAVNVSIRPILRFLSLPIRLITLGLFGLVVNGLCLLIAAKLVPGFNIDGFWTAVGAAAVYSLVTWLANTAFEGRDRHHRVRQGWEEP